MEAQKWVVNAVGANAAFAVDQQAVAIHPAEGRPVGGALCTFLPAQLPCPLFLIAFIFYGRNAVYSGKSKSNLNVGPL